MPYAIPVLSSLTAALAFGILGFLLLAERHPTGLRLGTALAAFLTSAWAIARGAIWYHGLGPAPDLLSYNLETLRSAGWIVVLIILLQRTLGLSEKPRSAFTLAASLGFIVALQISIVMVDGFDSPGFSLAPGSVMATALTGSRIAVAISGLVLLHNLYLNAAQQRGRAFRLLAIGLGIIFAYDLNLYTSYFLFGEKSITLLGLRGMISSVAAPLIYLPMRDERSGRFSISRQAAFQTASFAVIGLYLVAMALLAYGLRLTGGSWGELLQVVFLAGTLIAGAFLLLSPKLRARLRIFILRNFYRYRYDYRVEWLRFVNMIDASATTRSSIRERLIEAVAKVVDCPAGGLLEPDGNGHYVVSAHWQWPELELPPISTGGPFERFLVETGRIVNFAALRSAAPMVPHTLPDGSALILPDWIRTPNLWIAIPLLRRHELLGALILHKSLAPRILDWEDYAMLRTLGRQGASYLAESAIQARLDEAKNFEDYNRRATFVMHDLKNLVSQLALLARNAEKHAANPEFQADMTATLKESVRKMGDLLQLMRRDTAPAAATAAPRDERDIEQDIDMARLVSEVAATARRTHPAIAVSMPVKPSHVHGNLRQIEAMLSHILQNAIEASPADGAIELAVRKQPDCTEITVRDHGHGMSQEFINTQLFQPFRSTKADGFGIGVYEAREIARAHGGNIRVESRPGQGALFAITLPLRRGADEPASPDPSANGANGA